MKTSKNHGWRNVVFGFTRRDALLLDFDHVGLETVLKTVRRGLHKHRLRAFLVVRSTRASYHVVFDRPIPYARACDIIDRETPCWSQKNLCLRLRRKDTTLRVSGKANRGFPEPLLLEYEDGSGGRFGDSAVNCPSGGVIADYVDTLRLAKIIYKGTGKKTESLAANCRVRKPSLEKGKKKRVTQKHG